jgi:hypothetical protein
VAAPFAVRRPLVLLLGALASWSCGVKAPPRPPGLPAATRGGPSAPCCEIPAPDAVPTPSVPERPPTEGQPLPPPETLPETEPVAPTEETPGPVEPPPEPEVPQPQEED